MTDRPTILLVHGVGMSPELFAPLRDALGPSRCRAELRLGYRAGDCARPDAVWFAAMVDDLAELVADVAPAVVVGVSGGATLALALALAAAADPQLRQQIGHVVVHEPLIGPLAPRLHRAVAERAAILAATDDRRGPADFVESLVGAETWAQLPDSAQRFATRHGATVRAEVPLFASFSPSATELTGIRTAVTVSVGERSPLARHEAGRLLARLVGARLQVVDGAGHLASWQQPDRFALMIERAADRQAGRSMERPHP